MSRTVFVGLDLETSGTDVDAGAVPIQVGAALGASHRYSSLVGWQFGDPQDDWEHWSEEAAAVHKLDIESLRAQYPDRNAPAVDDELVAWLANHAAPGKSRSLVAVGWNVGSFDFPFVARYLPRTAALFSYRFVDLNAVCFTLAEAGARRARGADQAIGFKSWKKRAKAEAERMMGGESEWHDAGYDAAASLFAWWWLMDRTSPREGA